MRLKAYRVTHVSMLDAMLFFILTKPELSMPFGCMGPKTLIVCGLAVRFSA